MNLICANCSATPTQTLGWGWGHRILHSQNIRCVVVGLMPLSRAFQRMPSIAVQRTHSCGSKAPHFTSYSGACSMAPPTKQPREQERRLCVRSTAELSTFDLPAARASVQSASSRSQHQGLIRHHSPCGWAREKQR